MVARVLREIGKVVGKVSRNRRKENGGGSGAFIPARLVNSDRGFLDEIVPRNLKAPVTRVQKLGKACCSVSRFPRSSMERLGSSLSILLLFPPSRYLVLSRRKQGSSFGLSCKG